MKELGFGDGYKYPHDFENQFANRIFYLKKLMEINFTNQQIILRKRVLENFLKLDGETSIIIKFFSKRKV